MKSGLILLAQRLKESIPVKPFGFQKRWGLLWISLILLSQCTVQVPPQVIVLREGEVLVKQGDTISSLAQEYSVSPRALIEANHLFPPFSLEHHQKLRLPEKEQLAFEEISVQEIPTEETSEAEEASGPSLISEEANSDVRWVEIPLEDKPHTKKSDTEKKSDFSKEEKNVLLAPVDGEIVCHYKQPWKGIKSHGVHYKTSNKTVRSASSGTVLHIGPCYDKIYDQTSGKRLVVIVRHPDKLIGVYGPLETCYVQANQKVTAQTVLGKLQGNVLFFHLRRNNGKNRDIINPEPLIKTRAGAKIED